MAEKAEGLGAQAVAERIHAFVMGNFSTRHLTDDHNLNNTAETTGEDNIGEEGEITDEPRTTTTSSGGYPDPSVLPHPNHADNIPSQTSGKSWARITIFHG